MTFRQSIVGLPLAASALLPLLLGHGSMAHAAAGELPPTLAAAAPAVAEDGAARTEPVASQGGGSAATPAASELQTVTIVEQRIGALAKIDRDVYDVKSNPATSNASAADVLNNVPTVSVDADGKVSLRGSQNVRVMVNGKPAAQFQGADGGANLKSLPAAALDSVEVISTPGAEFGTEGGGGAILNLIMKRVQPPGAHGTLAANLGGGGRYNANGYATYSNGRVSADSMVSVRHEQHETSGESLRRRIEGAQTVATRQDTAGQSPSDSLMVSTTLNYNLGDKERLVATASLNRNETGSRRADHIVSVVDGQALPIEEVDRASVGNFRNSSQLLGVAYERSFARPNQELRVDLRYSNNELTSGTRFSNHYLIVPPGASAVQNFSGSVNPTRMLDLTADYNLPLTRESAMKAGLKLARQRGERGQDYFSFDPLTGADVVDANRSSAFASTELTYALYASYDRWVTDALMLRAGLRGEYTEQSMRYRQQQSTAEASNRYFLPNVAASYDFSKTSKLRLSYSGRVERPRVEDLNPFLLYQDEYNSSRGDPRLAPQKTRNYELGWDTRVGATRASLRLTREHSAPMFATLLVPVADSTTVISQRINFGYRQADTLSLNLSRTITPAWNVNGTITLGHDEQSNLSNQRGADGAIRSESLVRKGERTQLQLSTSYRIAPQTSLMLMAMHNGSQVTPFGVIEPWGTSTITLSHAFNDRLTLRFNLSDAFEWNRTGWHNDMGIVNDQSWSRTKGRVAYIGLSLRLGGVPGMAAMRKPSGAGAPRPAGGAAG